MDITNNLNNSNTITSSTNPPKRVRLESDDWIDKGLRPRLLERWKEQDLYIDHLELRLHQLQQSNELLREKEAECKKLKSLLNYRVLTKTTQQQSLDQMRDMMQTPSLNRLRQTYLDPSINLIYGKMRDEIEHCRKARDEAQNELHSLKFTSDSKTGKMLMARCKKLFDENEQLGKMVSSDNIAKLEGEIALQNRFLSNLQDTEKDCEDILLNMDTNMDAMSSTLLHMRDQLTDSHRQIAQLNEENSRLKALCQSTHKSLNTPNGANHTDSSSIISKTTNAINNNKSSQKRPHPSNRTIQNITTTNKLKTTNNLYDVDETTSPPPPLSSSTSNQMMDTESVSISVNSTITTNDNNTENLKRTNSLENGINTTP